MRAMNMKKAISKTQLLLAPMVAVTLLLTATAHAAAPGITGPTFNLTARPAFISQPDGQLFTPGDTAAAARRAALPRLHQPAQTCPTCRFPGPTLIVTQGTDGHREPDE